MNRYIIILAAVILHLSSTASADSLSTNSLVVEEYELGSTDELQMLDLVGLQVYRDSTLLSKRAKWRSEKRKVSTIYQHELYKNASIVFPSKIVFIEIAHKEYIGMEEVVQVIVWENDQVVCEITAHGSPVAGTIQTAYQWKDNWIIEFYDMVYVNCVNMNEELGYSHIFHYRIVNDKVFYFFKNSSGKYKLSYDGWVLLVEYDDIIRNMCCDPTILNPKNSELMIWFYAKRDNHWYYVEAGLFE